MLGRKVMRFVEDLFGFIFRSLVVADVYMLSKSLFNPIILCDNICFLFEHHPHRYAVGCTQDYWGDH